MAFRYQRGEDIRLVLAIVGDANEAAGVVVTANLKAAINVEVVPAANAPVVAALTVIPNLSPADGSAPGWYLILTATQSALLAPGTYVTSAELLYPGGSIEITEPLFITILQSTAA